MTSHILAKSIGAVEIIECFPAERKSSPNECPDYDTKQFNGEFPVRLEILGMQSTRALQSLPGPLWYLVVAPKTALRMS